ncbi:MAG: CheR family methyltransferase [Roseovarius sp.]
MASDTELSLSEAQFNRIRGIVRENTGISIADNRTSLLLSRLRSRLRETRDPDFKAYIHRVTSDSSELQELIDRVTTNKTFFYRTPRIWDHFRNAAIQDFVARPPRRPMRIWSAASSTGEEAFTAGMMLETVRAARSGFDYRILGTDISSKVVRLAEAGQYAAPALAQLRTGATDLFQQYVHGDDASGYRIAPAIKERVSFKLHNLLKPLSGGSWFDVVFLRNVLIYFTPEDQQTILRQVRHAMSPDAVLYIGESESISRLQTDFEIVEPMIYRPATSGEGHPA